MAEQRGTYRSIYGVLLDDPDYQALPEKAQHLFLVLKVTRLSNLAAIFVCDEGGFLTLKQQSGIPVPTIKKLLVVLEKAGWVYYEAPILWLKNGLKYEPSISLNNKNHIKAVESVLRGLPKRQIVLKFCDYYNLAYPFDTLSIPSRSTETETEPETKPETEPEKSAEQAPPKPPLERFNLWLQENVSVLVEIARVAKDPSYEFGAIRKDNPTDCWLRFQVKKMRVWILGNDKKANKKDWKRFVTHWLNRSLDKEPDSNFKPHEGYMTAAEEREYYASKKRSGPNTDFTSIGVTDAATGEPLGETHA
jgi:hypothetical protein